MLKLTPKHKQWIKNKEGRGLLPKKLGDHECYRVGKKVYAVTGLPNGVLHGTDHCENIWRTTPYYQSKSGKIKRKIPKK
jgi:hypothetical protein